MAADDALLLAVEHVRDRITVVRVAGDLSGCAVGRLARLLDRCTAPPPGVVRRRHLVVDLGDVRSFSVAGLQAVRRAAQVCARASMTLHVTGVASRIGVLPADVGVMLADLDCPDSLEEAVDALSALPAPAPRPVVDARTVPAPRHVRRRRRADLVAEG